MHSAQCCLVLNSHLLSNQPGNWRIIGIYLYFPHQGHDTAPRHPQIKVPPSPDHPHKQALSPQPQNPSPAPPHPKIPPWFPMGTLPKSPQEQIKPHGLQQAVSASHPSPGPGITIFHAEREIFKGKFPSGSRRIYLRGLPLAVIR